MKNRIHEYRFKDSKANILTLAVIHLSLAILLLSPPTMELIAWRRPHFCLLLVTTFFLLHQSYDWKSTASNIAWLGLYLLGLLYEVKAFGWPAAPMSMSNNGSPGKGIFTELFILALPYVYVGLRVAAGGLIIPLIIAARKLEKVAD